MKTKSFRSRYSWVLGSVFLTLFVYLLGQGGSLLLTSVMNKPQHDPFDGTTYPIESVPNWVKLTSAEYKMSYNEIPESKMMSIPKYDAGDFETSMKDLAWNDEGRNPKVTYSVPYMGDYSLDATEYSGSHLGVDIKIPMRTPIYAIANGVVIKASNQSSGYGKHVVLEHDNFPVLDNSSATTTYYSAYCHMDDLLVSEGDVVRKGDQIGLSGQTGTATTPHLHFQIDNDEPDWHPFWPFTWQDQQDAGGLSFFEAVNQGLGKNAAIASTVNPMEYVQKYLNGDKSTSKSKAKKTKTKKTTTEETTVETHEEASLATPKTVSTKTTVDDVYDEPPPAILKFAITLSDAYTTADTFYVKIKSVDENGKAYGHSFDGVIKLSLENDIATLAEDVLQSNDFSSDSVKIAVKNLKVGTDRLKLTYGQEIFYSNYFTVTQSIEDDSAPAANVRSFTDVFKTHANYEAIMYLANKGVVNGYTDGSFKPNSTVSRAEALKMILDGINASNEIDELSFKDISKNDWYYKYVSTGYIKKIVSGYTDNTFKPAKTVTKAEFLKMLFVAMDVSLPSQVREDPFTDVDKGEWSAPYFQYAKKHDIIDSNLRARPNNDMTRAEVAEAMYRVMN